MTNPSHGYNWITRLESSDHGKRLGACIAIDYSSGAVDTEKLLFLLNYMAKNVAPAPIGTLTDGTIEFLTAVDLNPRPDDFVCCSTLPLSPMAVTDRYERILSIQDFVTYYGMRYGLVPGAASDLECLEVFFNEDSGFGLADIDYWGGARGRIWVTSSEALRKFMSECTDDEVCRRVNDALGLGKSDSTGRSPTMVSVMYPAGFELLRGAQPTVFDGGLICYQNFFISFRKDNGWGRTHSCSGKELEHLERVHAPFGPLSADFEMRRVGNSSDPVTKDPSKLLKASLKRFEDQEGT
jgi:hypothetical protein